MIICVGDGYTLNNTLANFNWGNSWSWDGISANASINSTGTYPGTTQAVGSYPSNKYGLYDMHGNVFEWCLDQWDGDSGYGSSLATDPLSTSGPYRVLRGGYWIYSARNCRSAFRHYFNPGSADETVGFRVAVVP